MAENPAAAIWGACSLMVAYQLAPRCDSQLKPCRMISCPRPAAGPVLVAPPPCEIAKVFTFLTLRSQDTSPAGC